MDKWLLLAEKLLLQVIIEFKCSGNKSYPAFGDDKWMKDEKIIGCGNTKSLKFFKSCIQDIGELCPNATIEVISPGSFSRNCEVLVSSFHLGR